MSSRDARRRRSSQGGRARSQSLGIGLLGRPASTGVTLINLARVLGPDVPLVGYDYSQPMLDKARGRCLEMGNATYITRFGDDRVTRVDVMHLVHGNPAATIVADLTAADHVPSDAFDCIIFTQSLQMIYDMRAALRTLHRILKPGGVLLLTSHGISRIGRRLGRDPWGEYWRITTQSAEKLFAETFPGAAVEVGSYGNVLTACCCLHGIVSEEVSPDQLDVNNPDFEVIVTVHAMKGHDRPAGARS